MPFRQKSSWVHPPFVPMIFRIFRISPVRTLALFLVSFLILYLRRPETLIHPQFWAEDGSVWYQAAYTYHFSLATIVQPYAGYLGVFPRIIAELAWPLHIQDVPLFFNIVATSVVCVPVLYLWSDRFKHVVSSNAQRVLISILYLGLPYTSEIHGTITNSQWFLALLAFMLLFIKEPKSKLLKLLDSSLLLLAGLSGPFCIFLFGISFFEYVRNRKNSCVSLRRLAIIGMATIIQVSFIVFGDGTRSSGSLGYSFTQLFSILGGQVFGAGLFGHDSLTFFLQKPWIAPVITLIGLEVLVYVFIRGPKVLKYYIVFSILVFTAALFSPPGALPGGITWWQLLAGTISGGGRYYFLLHFAIILSLVWMASSKELFILKVAAVVLLASSLIWGFRSDFYHEPLKNYNYNTYIKRYNHLRNGQTIDVPINPGPPWQMHLIKR